MKITPKPPEEKNAVVIEDLRVGDCFVQDGCLCMLIDVDPEAVDLSNGERCHLDDNEIITPVDCSITWALKPKKKKK